MGKDDIAPYRWPKGVSGNPGGYSKKRRQIDDLVQLIEESGALRSISQSWLKEILLGSSRHLRIYLDRRDGPVSAEPIGDDSGRQILERFEQALERAYGGKGGGKKAKSTGRARKRKPPKSGADVSGA